MKRTLRHVIDEVTAHETSRFGGEAMVFDFPPDLPELRPYLVRRHHDFDPEWLNSTSALTPPKTLVGGMHVGQPLLQLDGNPGLAIVKRQNGISLKQWRIDHDTKLSRMGIHGDENACLTELAYYDLFQRLDAKLGNPFIKIFDEAYRLGQLGYTADNALSNLFVDEANHTLSLIDQLDPARKFKGDAQGELNIATLKEGLLFTESPYDCDPALIAQLHQKRHAVKALLDEAEELVLSHRFSELAKPAVFAKTDAVQGVALDVPPHHLVEKLRQIEKLADIPQR